MSVDPYNCPASQGFLPNDALGCHCYYVNQEKGIIDVSAATPYNITYYKILINLNFFYHIIIIIF